MRILIIILFLVPSFGRANVSTSMVLGKGKTEFLAIGNPGFLKIKGKGAAPKGDLKISNGKLNGTLTVDLKSLDTGMSLRNKHMKEKYLKVKAFPEATLKINDYKIPQAWSLKNPELEVQKIPATLMIQKESRPIVISAKINSKGKIDSSFDIKISDFKIEIPSFMGVTVADKVEVKITSKLSPKN